MPTYRATKTKLEPGQVRTKRWRYVLPPSGDNDPVWVKRIKDYWTLFERLYGAVVDKGTLLMHIDEENWTVSTWVRIDRVLPGKRVVNYDPPEGLGVLRATN
jgi:hypothetical protein